MSDTATHEACAAMAAIQPQHEALSRFAGKWRAEVRFWGGNPQVPHVSQGTMQNTLVLGGRFLQQEYRDDAGVFEGRGLWGYNTVEQRYEGLWVDSMATFFQLEYGQHDPATDTYTMTGTMSDPSTRQPLRKRSVIQYRGPGEHTLEMYFAGPDGRENKCMEIRYTRA